LFSLKRLRLREQRRQPLQKFSQKATQSPAPKTSSTARTAGRSDRAERRFRRQPFILLSFSFSEKPQKRRKRSHTNVSNTLVARPSTPPAQTPQRLFQKAAAGTHATPAPNRAHSGSQGETRGVLDGGWYHYPRTVLRGSETLWGRVSERRTLPLLGLGRERSRKTQRACGTAMRSCASLSRGAAGPQARAAPLLYLASHRWVPRFFRSQQQDAEKHICCFTRWSAPCVLPLAAVPLLCPQHSSGADKTGRWKTGSAGSCRADFRFACAHPA
jgi:hypothetical protein